jgi:hypothetical protein
MLEFNDFNMVDPGGYRAFVTPFEELLNDGMFGFSNDLNPAIRQVPDIPFYGKMLSLVLRKKAKVNALNPTRNQNLNSTHHS